MGAKTWMLSYADGNPRDLLRAHAEFDRDATLKLAVRLFPRDRLTPLDDVDLMYTSPPDDELCIACFPGLSVVAAKEFGIDNPSKLPSNFLTHVPAKTVYLHAMHSVVDWFAFAVWHEGKLQRSLSLSPDSGIIEDIGQRMSFEMPYWSGKHPAVDPADEDEGDPPYPFPFHPLELGEAALAEFFGFTLEGTYDPSHILPETVPLASFKRSSKKFRFWGR